MSVDFATAFNHDRETRICAHEPRLTLWCWSQFLDSIAASFSDHFNAPVYDLDGLDEAKFAAPFIPFGTKVRNVLDIGAGGGSLGLVLKQKYDLLTMSIIFPGQKQTKDSIKQHAVSIAHCTLQFAIQHSDS